LTKITGRTASLLLPPYDTPQDPEAVPRGSGSFPLAGPASDAAAAWRAVTLTIAGTPHVRISRDGGRTYPARHARPLPAEPPGQPCTVPVYDPGAGTGRLLALDLDPSRGRGAGDPAALVSAQAAELGQLLGGLGARTITDVAPSGGRHVFVLFAAALPWRELRDVARALALRFPAIDPAPMSGLGGQISPPGSRHKSGGWRLLSAPLEDARAAVEHPNGPEVWAALLAELAAELHHVEPVMLPGGEPEEAELDDSGVPWVPRLGGRASLGAGLEPAARTGRWDRTRYPGRSEARMAILSAAAERGWQLAEVQAAVDAGAWRGLARLYERASEPGRMARLLPAEWQKSVGFLVREKNVRAWPTSDKSSRPPVQEPASSAEYGHVRRWVTAVSCAAEDPDRVRGWGRQAIAVRLVLTALGQAGMVSGSGTIEFGTRNLALHSALSHRTVARILRMLRDEPDPLIDLVSPRRMARADRYQLRIPDRYADSVRWRRRRAGRVEAIHSVFLVLGGVAGLVYEVLGQGEARGAEVARSARLSASAVSAALRVLAEHGLAERGPGGWCRGAVGLDGVAESTGAADLQREREERYRQDRESWRARLRQYQGAKCPPVTSRDGWWPLDDQDEYDEMCQWPVLSDDFVRGPPPAEARDSA
jgi:DNA-binding transcriptional ArsR family regulator